MALVLYIEQLDLLGFPAAWYSSASWTVESVSNQAYTSVFGDLRVDEFWAVDVMAIKGGSANWNRSFGFLCCIGVLV